MITPLTRSQWGPSSESRLPATEHRGRHQEEQEQKQGTRELVVAGAHANPTALWYPLEHSLDPVNEVGRAWG